MEKDALLPSNPNPKEKRPSWTTKRGGWILTGVYLFGMVRFARLTVYTPVSYLYPLTIPNYIIVPSDVPFDFRWPHSIKPQVALGLVYAAQGPALLPLANQSG